MAMKYPAIIIALLLCIGINRIGSIAMLGPLSWPLLVFLPFNCITD